MSFLPLVRLWILLSVLASAAGWLLSACGQLNRTGYSLAAGLGLLSVFLLRRLVAAEARPWRPRPLRRFRRLLPLMFAVLAALVFLGGVLYAPDNYDGLTYRLPRVLNWLADGQWHWIHTANYRMNDRSCGLEWLMAPAFLATQSDRGLFLVNFVPFLLLPGLVFSVFARLGVSRRVAWHWMWLLPTGYNFLLQAGSIANDAFAAVYALAAVDFALRATVSRRVSDAWFSLLAAALMTGAKPGNLPLLLPWFIAFLPAMPLLYRGTNGCVGNARPSPLVPPPVEGRGKPEAAPGNCFDASAPLRVLSSVFVILLALLVSFAPTAILNHRHCGDWTGFALESSTIVMRHPLIGIAGNSVICLLCNFCPTLFPLAGWWNHAVPDRLPAGIAALVNSNFEANFCRLGEIPTEEWSGLGFGLSCLLAATVLANLLSRPVSAAPRNSWLGRAVVAAPWVSLLFFFAKSGMMTLARLVSAYYPLLLPALLRGAGAGAIVRRVWWRRATILVMVLAGVAIVLTPARPLWPAKTVLSRIGGANPALRRMRDVYFIYAERADPLAPARAAVPADCRIVGFVGAPDDPEISFWRPYGQRRVDDILAGDTESQIRDRQIRFAVVSEVFLRAHRQTIDQWLQQYHAALVSSLFVTTEVSVGLSGWYVVRFSQP